ncbi:MAG: hypothetical protein L3K19_02520 [Thermoplasmata archaeon]|nr:hypothetical protein [Thermoplasmata archaeon]
MGITPRLRRWLLSNDQPSVRFRWLRDVEQRAPDDPELRRAQREVPRRGWAADILASQLGEGQWDSPGTTSRQLYVPKYIATNWRLIVLSEMGVDRRTKGAARGAELLMRREGGPRGGLGGSNSEVCFTGNAVRTLVRLGYADDRRVQNALEWLVHHQKQDGGWHCFRSKSGTLDGWEAMAAFAVLPDSLTSPEVRRATERGAEFYLKRGLLREGRTPYPPWTRLHYPSHYYYDLLVGLEMMTRLGYGRDPRLGPALDLLESKRNPDGSWNLDVAHPDLPVDEPYQPRTPLYPFVLEHAARPSRWITVSALAILRRAGREV